MQLIIFLAVNMSRAWGGISQCVPDETGYLTLAFYFLNMDQLFKNYYFRDLFSITLNSFTPRLCAASLIFFYRVEINLRLSGSNCADIESRYRCL